MAKMTKTQARRLAVSMRAKASKLFLAQIGSDSAGTLSMKEFDTISKIAQRILNKLK